MRIQTIAAASLASTLLAASAAAAPPPSEGGRFQIAPADGGFLRLDRETGATAFCKPSGDGYACRPTVEEGRPSPEVTTEIEKRVAAIERQLKETQGLPPVPPLPKTDGPSAELPSDDQMDRVASFIERAMKRLKELAQEMQKDTPPSAESDRQRL